MYERSYGEKYQREGDAGAYLSAADIAKKMRADIKASIASGELPGTAKNYSVRVENYSGGRSIDIRAIDLDGTWQQCEGIIPGSEDGLSARSCGNVWCKAGGLHRDSEHAKFHDILSVEGQRVEKVLKKIHWAYNYDGSEIMVDYHDVNFYGQARVEDKWEASSRRSHKAHLDRLKARREARKVSA